MVHSEESLLYDYVKQVKLRGARLSPEAPLQNRVHAFPTSIT